jgi:hypothetical protein
MRQREIFAEVLRIFIGSKARAVGCDLEQNAVRFPEINREEVVAVDHFRCAEAGGDDSLTPGPLRFRIGRAKSHMMHAASAEISMGRSGAQLKASAGTTCGGFKKSLASLAKAEHIEEQTRCDFRPAQTQSHCVKSENARTCGRWAAAPLLASARFGGDQPQMLTFGIAKTQAGLLAIRARLNFFVLDLVFFKTIVPTRPEFRDRPGAGARFPKPCLRRGDFAPPSANRRT